MLNVLTSFQDPLQSVAINKHTACIIDLDPGHTLTATTKCTHNACVILCCTALF